MGLNVENAKVVLEKVKKLEKEYDSDQDRTLADIEACYTDSYILKIWEDENKDDDGWDTFENFLVDFIEQNIQLG